ncbi:MAG: hypothetical protein MUF34_18505 [Polyangiaceae bacterium]|nr:hypothetical protein [Polyangiaceae bacterium]
MAPAAPGAASGVKAAAEGQGVVVVASGDSIDLTWALASVVYRDSVLRPKGLRDEEARVLGGEAPGASAPASLRETSELRASLRGDDAPSRSVLATIAQRTNAALVLVVFAPPGGGVSARPFDPKAGRFEAWSLVPDSLGPPAPSWASAPGELRRRYVPPAASTKLAARPPAKAPPAEKPRHWWSSPWLWGALGVAAVAAGVVVLTTSGSNDDPTSSPSRVNIRVDR